MSACEDCTALEKRLAAAQAALREMAEKFHDADHGDIKRLQPFETCEECQPHLTPEAS
jgi:hypothetical protein